MSEVKEGYSLSHAFKFFKTNNPLLCRKHNIDKKLYRDICKDFNKIIVTNVLEGKAEKLPFGCGMLWIKKFKMNWSKLPIDFKATKEFGKTMFHLNVHSDGWCARWAWIKRNQLVANLIFYKFKPTWTNSRTLAAIMKSSGGHKKFLTQQRY